MVGLSGIQSTITEEGTQTIIDRSRDGRCSAESTVDGEQEYIQRYIMKAIGIYLQGYSNLYCIGGIRLMRKIMRHFALIDGLIVMQYYDQ